MTPDERERMNLLVHQIQVERNYNKLIQLVQDLNDLIAHKRRRLEPKEKPDNAGSATP